MYHLVYLTTNLINGKFYVGVHSTYNLNDGYLGSGKHLKNSINKYGKENFKRDILYYCLTEQESLLIESIIVDEHFISSKDTYNIALGGGKPDISSITPDIIIKRGKKLSDTLRSTPDMVNKRLYNMNTPESRFKAIISNTGKKKV